jgi:ribosome-associated protein
MDIRKLQRAIVDGLEDVKGQNIAVFNTEHLSPLFERVIIASGTSNRQTKALAASVRDAVKAAGHGVMRTEGEDNGEWIIVDCGAAVVHLMQPTIREYYHLEEIWGDKPVRMKLDSSPRRLVKAESEDDDEPGAPKRPARKAVAKKSPAKATPAAVAAGAKTPARAPARPRSKASTPSSPAPRAPAKAPKATAKTPATSAPKKLSKTNVTKIEVGKPAAKKALPRGTAPRPAPAKVAARKGAGTVTRTTGVKSAGRSTSATPPRPAAAKKAPRRV